VLRQLTDARKLKRMPSFRAFLTRYHAEGEQFLSCSVTGDETWVHYYEQESRRQSMEWLHTSSPAKKKFKSAPSAGELMVTLFWDMNGLVREHYQEKGESVNSVRYSTMLEEKLKPTIRCRCRRLLCKGVLLLHDNARPHSAAATVTTIQKLKYETTNHPPYSPDLAPSDYHVFGMLKEALRGRRFHRQTDRQTDRRGEGDGAVPASTTTTKNFLQEYRSLSKDVKSALQRTVTTWKNNILFGTVYMMCISI
jgi:histone-lysine N-methyltransferase SETMAR